MQVASCGLHRGMGSHRANCIVPCGTASCGLYHCVGLHRANCIVRSHLVNCIVRSHRVDCIVRIASRGLPWEFIVQIASWIARADCLVKSHCEIASCGLHCEIAS